MIIFDLCPSWAQGKEVKQFGKFRNPIGAGADGYSSHREWGAIIPDC